MSFDKIFDLAAGVYFYVYNNRLIDYTSISSLYLVCIYESKTPCVELPFWGDFGTRQDPYIQRPNARRVRLFQATTFIRKDDWAAGMCKYSSSSVVTLRFSSSSSVVTLFCCACLLQLLPLQLARPSPSPAGRGASCSPPWRV